MMQLNMQNGRVLLYFHHSLVCCGVNYVHHESTNFKSGILPSARIASPYILFFTKRHVFGYLAFLVEVELESHKNIVEHYLLRSTNEMGPS